MYYKCGYETCEYKGRSHRELMHHLREHHKKNPFNAPLNLGLKNKKGGRGPFDLGLDKEIKKSKIEVK